MQIRQALPGELGFINRLIQQSKQSWGYSDAQMALWREALTVDQEYLHTREALVVVDEGVIRGFLGVDPTSGEIEHLWIDPPSMGHGYGRALVSRAKDLAREVGLARLQVTTDPNARRFYQRLGFELVARVPSRIRERQLPVMAWTVTAPG